MLNILIILYSGEGVGSLQCRRCRAQSHKGVRVRPDLDLAQLPKRSRDEHSMNNNRPPLWKARTEALTFLRRKRPAQIEVIERLFLLADDCIDAYEAQADDRYSKVCGLTTLKAKNLAHGMFSLTLDGLAQEAGALARPFIEYGELLTYFRMLPEAVNGALAGELPSPGIRAKKIEGIYKPCREHLNEHASHSSYSSYSLAHLTDPTTKRVRKLQAMHPAVFERNVGDFAVQFILMLQESVLGLERSPDQSRMTSLASCCDELRARIFAWFPPPPTAEPGSTRNRSVRKR
jgi:hypothetical protein